MRPLTDGEKLLSEELSEEYDVRLTVMQEDGWIAQLNPKSKMGRNIGWGDTPRAAIEDLRLGQPK